MAEAAEEHKLPRRSRQPNGTPRGEPPVRRSWRPCQMMNQDGEVNPHHHHHHHHHHPPHHHHHAPTGRGPPRHRRRPPSGQGQGQVQSPGLALAASSTQDCGESRDTEHHPVQQPRPAVARYRRHGDPNPRHRGHRQRPPNREVQESSHVDDREGPADVQVQQRSADESVTEQSQDKGSPHHTPVAVVTPTHLSPGPATHNIQPQLPYTPPPEAEEDLQDHKVECEEELEEVKEKDEEQEQTEDDLDHHTGCNHDDIQTGDDGAEECAERVEEDQEEMMDEVGEDIAAQGSEITDLCSDTESAASLSMDGPLHSPPPLQSPTPPSSPDTSYPELHREPCRQPNRRTDTNEQEYRQEPFTSHREVSAQKMAPTSPTKGSYHAPRQIRDRTSHHSPLDRSVGCRLHHYDGQSDGEGDSGIQSPVSKGRRQGNRHGDVQDKSPSSGQSSSGEAPEERNAVGVPGEEGQRGSGDAITLAIKDIKEAIEEVKTKTVRSPYTPDQPMEPIWVMRQEVSPTEDAYPLQTTAGHEQILSWTTKRKEESSNGLLLTPPLSRHLSLRPATPQLQFETRSVRGELSHPERFIPSITTNNRPNTTITTTKPTSLSRGRVRGRRRDTHSHSHMHTCHLISTNNVNRFTINNSLSRRLHLNS
ncbi:hypothetical protein INR49_023417 [Caranx melampygus]|nr:hypothetical protein INR49_023417 [Caranx melampygus]